MPFDDEELPYPELESETEILARKVIGAAIEVHRQLGPGLDESLYESGLAVEFRLRGIPFVRQAVIQVGYKGEVIGEKRLDFIVAGKLIVELKSIDLIGKVHCAQVNTYLKITGKQLGLLINFNVSVLKDGIRRIIRTNMIG